MPSMTPSNTMSDDQVNELVNVFRDQVVKHQNSLELEAAQAALGTKGIAAAMFAPFLERAEAVSNIITRYATVVPGISAKQAIDATGRFPYVYPNVHVLASMPRNQNDGVEQPLHFFKLGRYVSCAGLVKEYELRGLEPVDPYLLAAFNQADPVFADEHPNGTQWVNSAGKFCYEAFRRWGGERLVDVSQSDVDWSNRWWFAGVRSPQT